MTKLRYTKAQLKFFREQGKIGGQKLKEERGREYYSQIGKISGDAKKAEKK